MSKINLEIACFNLESCLIAQNAGADRIELCENISLGGITPSDQLVEKALLAIQINLFLMIRPRGGNFNYSTLEFETMKKDIQNFKSKGVKGFVFGILDENKNIDKIRNKELVELAMPLPCTFHRAFDESHNCFEALEHVISCGFKTILSSGQKKTALEGVETLKKLILLSEDRIIIMPGGTVRSENIGFLKNQLHTKYFHSSAIIDNTELANQKEIEKLKLI